MYPCQYQHVSWLRYWEEKDEGQGERQKGVKEGIWKAGEVWEGSYMWGSGVWRAQCWVQYRIKLQIETFQQGKTAHIIELRLGFKIQDSLLRHYMTVKGSMTG